MELVLFHARTINRTNWRFIIKYTVKNKDEYLLFTFSGEYDYNKHLNLISAIKSECVRNNVFKVMTDNRLIKNQSISNLDKFNLGVEISKVLNSKIQLAILDNQEDTDNLIEITANNRSSFVKSSLNRNELLEWLS